MELLIVEKAKWQRKEYKIICFIMELAYYLWVILIGFDSAKESICWWPSKAAH
jgi:hypothetical protein